MGCDRWCFALNSNAYRLRSFKDRIFDARMEQKSNGAFCTAKKQQRPNAAMKPSLRLFWNRAKKEQKNLTDAKLTHDCCKKRATCAFENLVSENYDPILGWSQKIRAKLLTSSLKSIRFSVQNSCERSISWWKRHRLGSHLQRVINYRIFLINLFYPVF